MKRAFIITSAIETGQSPLTYSAVRSHFTSRERFFQTKQTIDSVNQIRQSEDFVYIVDTSNNWQEYCEYFEHFKNLKFVSVKEQFENIFDEVTTHANKSRCETLITSTFLEQYKNQLDNFDITVKLSGRYCIDTKFNLDIFTKDRIFFKRPWQFPWQDWWNYDAVKLDSEYLRQYCSVIFAWGQEHNQTVKDLYKPMADTLAKSDMQHYDMETLLYFYTRPLYNHIEEIDCTVYGHLGATGQFVKY